MKVSDIIIDICCENSLLEHCDEDQYNRILECADSDFSIQSLSVMIWITSEPRFTIHAISNLIVERLNKEHIPFNLF